MAWSARRSGSGCATLSSMRPVAWECCKSSGEAVEVTAAGKAGGSVSVSATVLAMVWGVQGCERAGDADFEKAPWPLASYQYMAAVIGGGLLSGNRRNLSLPPPQLHPLDRSTLYAP
eukprot:365881-Chlamydomonas_euryale.AAC.4